MEQNSTGQTPRRVTTAGSAPRGSVPPGKKRPAAKKPAGRPAPSKRPVKRKPPTPEQIRRAEARRAAAAARRQRALIRFTAALLVFLTFYLIISLAVVGLFALDFKRTSAKGERYAVAVYEPRKNETQKDKLIAYSSADDSYIGGALYISYTDLDTLCGLSVVGDNEKLTLIFRKSREYLVCYADSALIYSNSVPASLTYPVIRRSGEYYFPIELIENYFDGVTVTYAGAGTSARCSLTMPTADTAVGLRVKPVAATEAVSEPESSE